MRLRDVTPSIGYAQWLCLGYTGTLYDFFRWLTLLEASDVLYDSSNSGLFAGDVQTALDSLAADREVFQKTIFKDSEIPDTPAKGHYPETLAVKSYVDNAISDIAAVSMDLPSPIASDNAVGESIKYARSDHVHKLGGGLRIGAFDSDGEKEYYFNGAEDVVVPVSMGFPGPPGVPGDGLIVGPQGPPGLNAFEVWQSLPGNEDKILDDFWAFLAGFNKG